MQTFFLKIIGEIADYILSASNIIRPSYSSFFLKTTNHDFNRIIITKIPLAMILIEEICPKFR